MVVHLQHVFFFFFLKNYFLLSYFFFFFFFFRNSRSYLLIDWLLCWVFVSVRGLSLAVASGDHSSSRCAGLSLSRPLSLRSTGSRRAGSAICGSRAQLLHGMQDLPRPGLEPVSPALAGRFSTTAPPGKPSFFLFLKNNIFIQLHQVLVAACGIFFAMYGIFSCGMRNVVFFLVAAYRFLVVACRI